MKYIYTSDKCSVCINLKEQYDKLGVKYVERDAVARLKAPTSESDSIDRDAFVKLAAQNMELPVEIDVDIDVG